MTLYRTVVVAKDMPGLLATKKLIETSFPEISIIGAYIDTKIAIVNINSLNPELLISDFQLNGINGIDLLNQLIDASDLNILFLSDDGLIPDDFEGDYTFEFIQKPLPEESLQAYIEKLEIRRESSVQSLQVTSFKRIVLNQKDKIRILDFSEINRFEAAGPYTFIILASDERIVTSKPIKYFESMLRGKGFIRPHRSHLFNVFNIKEIKKDTDGGGIVYFKSGRLIVITEVCKNELIRLVNVFPFQFAD